MRFVCLLTILYILLPAVLCAQQQRDMLVNAYPKAFIEKQLDENAVPSMYPAYKNRQRWDAINPKYKSRLIKEGEAMLGYTWQTVPASAYLEFTKSGNRYIMEDLYNQNLAAIKKLGFAELAEGKKRFLPQLINGVWALCETTSWSISASFALQKKGGSLPDVEEPIVELGAGITANLLAWIYHFFNREFDAVNPLISTRLKQEIERRILEPYYNRTDFWWMALGDKPKLVNNWNVWLNYNALTCMLLVESNKSKKINGIYKSMQSVDKFINYYKNDGGCEEGPAYWAHAGGMLYNYLGMLKMATGNAVNLFDSTLIKNIGAYICKAYIGNGYYLNYADAAAKYTADAGIVFQFGKAIHDTSMTSFAAYLAQQQNWDSMVPMETAYGGLRNLFFADEIKNTTTKEPFLKDVWLEGTGIAVARDKAGSSDGFYFSALAGHNNESHNHNDVGTCVLFYNGQPLLIDVGNETYTKQTFGPDRYSIWTMRSAYHNVPLINGVEQKEGRQYEATEVAYKSSNAAATFSLDIAKAYPPAANVVSWKRSYELKRHQSFILTDKYKLLANSGNSELHFMSSASIEKMKEGLLQFTSGNVKMNLIYDAKTVDAIIEEVPITDAKLLQSWPSKISRLIFKINNKKLVGTNKLIFQKPV